MEENGSHSDQLSGFTNEILMEILNNFRIFVEEKTKKKPYQSFGIAIGVGVLLGRRSGQKKSFFLKPFVIRWIAKAVFRTMIKGMKKKFHANEETRTIDES